MRKWLLWIVRTSISSSRHLHTIAAWTDQSGRCGGDEILLGGHEFECRWKIDTGWNLVDLQKRVRTSSIWQTLFLAQWANSEKRSRDLELPIRDAIDAEIMGVKMKSCKWNCKVKHRMNRWNEDLSLPTKVVLNDLYLPTKAAYYSPQPHSLHLLDLRLYTTPLFALQYTLACCVWNVPTPQLSPHLPDNVRLSCNAKLLH